MNQTRERWINQQQEDGLQTHLTNILVLQRNHAITFLRGLSFIPHEQEYTEVELKETKVLLMTTNQ